MSEWILMAIFIAPLLLGVGLASWALVSDWEKDKFWPYVGSHERPGHYYL